MRQFLHDHSLSIAFGALTASSFASRVLTAYHDWDDKSGMPAEIFVLWGESTWEMLQGLALILFSKWFVERGSAESKE